MAASSSSTWSRSPSPETTSLMLRSISFWKSLVLYLSSGMVIGLTGSAFICTSSASEEAAPSSPVSSAAFTGSSSAPGISSSGTISSSDSSLPADSAGISSPGICSSSSGTAPGSTSASASSPSAAVSSSGRSLTMPVAFATSLAISRVVSSRMVSAREVSSVSTICFSCPIVSSSSVMLAR